MMPTAIYKINTRFDYCDESTLQRHLQSKGITARVESDYPYNEIRITSDAPANILNDAVDHATMHYCPECVRRLKALNEELQ